MTANQEQRLVVIILILLVIALSALPFLPKGKIESHRYQLNNGETVTCNGQSYSPCGMHYFHCENGKSYDCQTNVKNLD